jgi:toxin YhaV
MVVNGWRLYVHPLFEQQFRRLVEQVEALAAKDPAGYKELPAAKLLATINRHIRETIPRNPVQPSFAREIRLARTTGTGSGQSSMSGTGSFIASPARKRSSFTRG